MKTTDKAILELVKEVRLLNHRIDDVKREQASILNLLKDWALKNEVPEYFKNHTKGELREYTR